MSKKLASYQPGERTAPVLLELAPEGQFLTYGLGVSLAEMAKPSAAQRHVSVR